MYVIDSESNGNHSIDDPIKFLTRTTESSLCDYSDAYILVTGNTTATPNNAVTPAVLKNWAPFKKPKLMTLSLIMQILLMLQCLCTI